MSDKRPLIAINCNSFSDAKTPIVGTRVPYCRAVLAAGGTPLLIPFLENAGQIDAVLDCIGGMMLTGGDDMRAERLGAALHASAVPIIPERDRSDFILIERLIARRIPTLAICLGFQELNVHLGGTIYQDLPTEYPASEIQHGSIGAGLSSHTLNLVPNAPLSELWNGVSAAGVNSSHHQGIRKLAPALEPCASTADGLIEAAMLRDHPFFLGVQWHPERMTDDPRQRALFSTLIRHAS